MGYSGGKLAPWFGTGPIKLAATRMARDGGERLTMLTKLKTPVGETGHLKESWKAKPVLIVVDELGRTVYESGTETGVDYAPYVEWGTGLWGPKHAKYVIRPRNPNGWLRWIGKDGSPVFAKEVMHPGSPGNHMFAIGVALTEHEFDQIAAPSVERCMNRLENAIHRHGRDGRSLLA